ncbi:phospholipase B1, membrane-associated [Lingula anatina]|uniref:Phospholipase B1, membrane-associated n=1 Tax=Lingula anatina TaxID=7574 RepID=A0A2R2MU56_LINAN|nr:phospholipase B1, membrane-associated [Lingula anatina]|eukprot:XP_023933662.1 phospholipase B1, membrane-associated [Lingula anatina]
MASYFAFGLLLCCLVSQSLGRKGDFYERYKDVMFKILTNETLEEEWYKHLRDFGDPYAPQYVDFQRSDEHGRVRRSIDCGSQVSETVPTSVHRLRPGDIKVVAAMGDSLTAGNGILAWTVLGCLTEYRGRSWCIGGDKSLGQGVVTLPNILRAMNPEVRGYSLGYGDVDSSGANLNVAVPGNIAQDMPPQAEKLVRLLQEDSASFEHDWKMITLFIGGNNLCDFCNDDHKHSAGEYARNIKAALDTLYASVPRAFVNLVQIFDIGPVAELGTGFICGLVHDSVCGCGHDARNREALRDLAHQYQAATEALINGGRYDGREDFTVVLQPFLQETTPPRKSNGDPDLSYFAPDCFHFSGKGQAASAKALWNTMLEPVGSKRTEWRLSDSLMCPTAERPYLATARNS